MSKLNENVISEKTLILWLFLSAISTIACMLVSAVVVFFVYDCWPIERYPTGEGLCLSRVKPPSLVFVPMIIGVLMGSLLTRKMK